MVRVPRHRERPLRQSVGTWRLDIVDYYTGPTNTASHYLRQEVCNDWVGSPVAPSHFGCVSVKGDHARVSGVCDVPLWPGQPWRFTFNDCPINQTNPLDTSPLGPPSGWVLDLVAGTNPSRPVVTPPTLIQDLVELPKMLREAGRFLTNPRAYAGPKGLADVFLSVKFGWAPLIDDITKILDLQKDVDKRAKELHRLASGRGLRRKLTFRDDNQAATAYANVATIGSSFATLNLSCDVRKRTWGTITWRPTILPPYHPGDAGTNALARQIVLGLTPEGLAKGAWDVIPWTWLLGWCTNVGKFALAYSNTVPATWSNACFMSQVTTSVRPAGITYSGPWEKHDLRFSGGYVVTDSNRTVGTGVAVGVNMPFMDMSRLSVLGALFSQRFMR